MHAIVATSGNTDRDAGTSALGSDTDAPLLARWSMSTATDPTPRVRALARQDLALRSLSRASASGPEEGRQQGLAQAANQSGDEHLKTRFEELRASLRAFKEQTGIDLEM